MMSTNPTQTPRAHHLSVDVPALHDLWRACARDPREHVDERGSYWLAVRWSPFAVPVPPILPAALPADARAPTIRAAPVLHTGAEPSADYRVEPGRQGCAEMAGEQVFSLAPDPAKVLPPTPERFEDVRTVEELELWLMANNRAPNEVEREAARQRWASEWAGR